MVAKKRIMVYLTDESGKFWYRICFVVCRQMCVSEIKSPGLVKFQEILNQKSKENTSRIYQ